MRHDHVAENEALSGRHHTKPKAAMDESTLREIIGKRICNQIEEIMTRMDKDELTLIASLPNTQDVIATFIKSLNERSAIEEECEYQNAIQEGLKYKRELLTKDGGVISASEIAQLLRITRQAVDLRRKQNKLLAVTLTGGKEYYYPVWQLDKNGANKNFVQVMAHLTHMDPWSKMIFWLTDNTHLGGKRPIDQLKDDNNLNRIVQTARLTGDQGG